MLVDRAAEHLGRAISAVTEEPARIEIEPFERALNHAFGSQHLRLPDCRGRLDIDDDRVLDVDQVVRRVGEEGLAAVRPCPARRWVGGLLASALIRLASTANPSPPTSRSSMQRRKTLSNTRRKRSRCRKRPCLFLENVE